MAYLVNSSRLASLQINGVDYTSQMISWQCSDASAYQNGFLETTGTVVLGFEGGGPDVEDYERDNFKRGMPVILDMRASDGTTYRHPRGYLHVLSTAFEVESLTLTVELGCKLVMSKLTDTLDELLALAPVTLDVTQREYENISAAFASVGQYLYQNNQGEFESSLFFDGDTTATVAPGEWLSVLGRTAMSVQPLAGSSPIPDKVTLSYQVPLGSLSDDQQGRIDTTLTESYYFTQYPAIVYTRTGDALDSSAPPSGQPIYINALTYGSNSSNCGNTPDPPPSANQPVACNEGYTTEQTPVFLPAYRRDRTETHYSGPAAQVSYAYQEVRGPAIEANAQYYADKFAYCRYTWAHACLPNGDCPFDGMTEILLGYTETVNYFGDANEIVKTIVDTYATTLSGAQPSDWRSGVVNGAPQDFNGSLSTSDMYRVSRQITEFKQQNNANIQETTTFTSVTSRGTGISSGEIDALQGIRTFQRRTSTSNVTLDVTPDLVNSPTTDTREESTTIHLFAGRYQQPPAESGPYIEEAQIPMPLLYETRSEIDNAVDEYQNYLARFIKGDSLGLQIGESLREDVAQNWRPNMPFRYYDVKRDHLLAMRMNATSWGVSQDEASFVTGALWLGISDGTVTLPDNIVGDSGPDMGAGGTPPSPIVPPSVDDEDYVDSGTVAWTVNVYFNFTAEAVTYSEDGVQRPPMDPQTIQADFTMQCYVTGFVVEAGDLLAAEADGSIPTELKGTLVTVDATLVVPDLFGSA